MDEINSVPVLFRELKKCTCCPRNCSADRYLSSSGYCKSGASFNVASVCIHKGEEPVISGSKGICNIFFTHCNLRCIYCQNYEISNNSVSNLQYEKEPVELLREINDILDTGINIVGFVSPGHNIPQMKFIIESLRNEGKNPVFVFNTNAFDKSETIRSLEKYIDVYLPDFKYCDGNDAVELSDAEGYPETALKAIGEMYYQKGSTLITDDDGYAVSGLIIRHLILPGYADKSIRILRTIAEEISVSVHISLMSQYHPTEIVKQHPVFGRTVTREEYLKVVAEIESLGFKNGWIQDFDSHQNYLPDFGKPHPFES